MTGMDAHTGRALSGIDHLYQSLADILLTPIGTRIARRTYGSLLPLLIDQPLTGANVLRLYAATAYAIRQWEPRLRLTAIQLDIDMQGAAVLSLDGQADGSDIQIRLPVGPAVRSAA